MARPKPPCPVPSCKGSLEPGKKDGKVVEFCPVCERRIHQLAALHKRLAAATEAPAARPGAAAPTVDGQSMDDAALIALVRERFLPLKSAARDVKRGLNLLREAVEGGEILCLRLSARFFLVSRAGALAWAASRPPRYLASVIAEALPRTPLQAVTAEELAARAKLPKQSVYTWLSRAKDEKRLQITAKLNARQVAARAYWWQEAPHA